MNYFKFYELPVHYNIDQKKLRKLFLQKSKEFHPDFHGFESDAEQLAVLEKSSLNNEAYKVLKDDQSRLKYILEQKNMLGESVKNNLPQAFLMEMMDINEQLMELQFDYEQSVHENLTNTILSIEKSIKVAAEESLNNYHESTEKAEDLQKLLDYYLKSRYIRRLRKNMEKLELN